MVSPYPLSSLRTALENLDLDQKRELLFWLTDAIALEEQHQVLIDLPQRLNAVVVERLHYEGKLYQHEKRRCGKEACRCAQGELSEVGHGPYWYAYWREQGRLRSQYVGKRPPWDRV